ncbi:unnamed protein product [Candida verbasci]|uniref:NADH dehydrogenase [ubiquinone] 1 alpha subcomplex subunit 13 n=1 Tax=Candida verbasci TaxID=1227364 RepID=A0A9W4TRS2_9ASCO|nr:unnamed protein product [Candida verbasci]
MQDLPPIGGYEPIQWKRNLPTRGYRPSIYFWGIVGIMSFGFYRVYHMNDEQRELTRERNWARFHLQPLLTAEDDRNLVRRYLAELERQNLVKENLTPEARDKFEKELYNDKSKFRFPRYTAGTSPSESS